MSSDAVNPLHAWTRSGNLEITTHSHLQSSLCRSQTDHDIITNRYATVCLAMPSSPTFLSQGRPLPLLPSFFSPPSHSCFANVFRLSYLPVVQQPATGVRIFAAALFGTFTFVGAHDSYAVGVNNRKFSPAAVDSSRLTTML